MYSTFKPSVYKCHNKNYHRCVCIGLFSSYNETFRNRVEPIFQGSEVTRSKWPTLKELEALTDNVASPLSKDNPYTVILIIILL